MMIRGALPTSVIWGGQRSMADNHTAATIGFEFDLWRAAGALCSNMDAPSSASKVQRWTQYVRSVLANRALPINCHWGELPPQVWSTADLIIRAVRRGLAG